MHIASYSVQTRNPLIIYKRRNQVMSARPFAALNQVLRYNTKTM